MEFTSHHLRQRGTDELQRFETSVKRPVPGRTQFLGYRISVVQVELSQERLKRQSLDQERAHNIGATLLTLKPPAATAPTASRSIRSEVASLAGSRLLES